jgi:hypothetical protein
MLLLIGVLEIPGQESYRAYLPGGSSQPSIIYGVDQATLNGFGIDPSTLQYQADLSKQLGLSTVNGDFYGIAGGQNFNNDVGGLSNIFNSYIQNNSTKQAQTAAITQSNTALGANAYQGGTVTPPPAPAPTAPTGGLTFVTPEQQAQAAQNTLATQQGTNPLVQSAQQPIAQQAPQQPIPQPTTQASMIGGTQPAQQPTTTASLPTTALQPGAQLAWRLKDYKIT